MISGDPLARANLAQMMGPIFGQNGRGGFPPNFDAGLLAAAAAMHPANQQNARAIVPQPPNQGYTDREEFLRAAKAIQAEHEVQTAEAAGRAFRAAHRRAIEAAERQLAHPPPPPSSLPQAATLSPAPSSRSSEASVDVQKPPKQRRSTKDTSNPDSLIPGEYQCPICPQILTNQRSFTAHIRSHNDVKGKEEEKTAGKVFYCCLCGKMLSSFSSLDRHMLVHSGERPFACTICGQTFTTNGNMHRHTRTHGSRDSHESDNSSGSSGSARRGSRKRKMSVDQSAPTMVPNPSPRPPTRGAAFNQVGIKCPLCSEVFYEESLVDSHVINAHQGQPIKCSTCPIELPNYACYKMHKALYHSTDAPNIQAFQARMQELVARVNVPSPPIEIEQPCSPPKLPKMEPKIEEPKVEVVPPPPSPKIEEPDLKSGLDLTGGQLKLAPVGDLVMASPKAPSKNGSNVEDDEDEHEADLKAMKIKGEFPCRLCSAIYPNLRALKGHNKEHMTKAPYICNVARCTFTSNDKGTLVRHMRIHTGEKPFQCSICSFGFTTKANCERHVKNKHNKSSRSEVGDSITVHTEHVHDGSGDNVNTSFTESNSSVSGDMASPRPRKEDKEEKKKPLLFAPYSSSMFKQADETSEKISEKSPNSIRSDEAPLDLSKADNAGGDEGQNLLMMEAHTQEQVARNVQATAATASFPPFAASPAPPAFPPSFPPLQLLLPHLAATGQLTQATWIHNELLRRQQEIANAQRDPAALLSYLSNLQSLRNSQVNHQMATPAPAVPTATITSQAAAVAKPESDSDSGEYKMVIKNGVLMKKQKQRRYRTERPFQCEYCHGRFTLRSNMDRHIKQQHPGKPLPKHKEESKDTPEDESVEDLGVNMAELETFLAKVSGQPIESFFENDCEELKHIVNTVACAFCGLETIPNLAELREHILAEHAPEKKLTKCSDCPLWFLCKYACQRHIFRVHGNKTSSLTTIEEEPNKCPICANAIFASQTLLTEHMYADHHLNHKEEDNTSNEGDVDEGKEEEMDVGSSDKEVASRPEAFPVDQSPFKCHLCEEAYPDRELAIDHLKLAHEDEYNELIEKDAFNSPQQRQQESSSSPNEVDTYEHIRGRIPDYVNRKVVCLFCMRKFWSAEDLRRHVRTHTGERPFECDICKRRFTLKHSMLRHRKKHDSGVSSSGELSCDEGTEDSEGATTSSGRFSPEDVANANAKEDSKQAAKQKSELKKKRLMDKINMLSSAATNSS